jgi:hypothetical protein
MGINQQWGYETTKVERNGDISVLTFVNVAGVPTASTVSLTNSPVQAAREPEREPGPVRAGQVDAAAADAHLRRAVRLLQRLDAGAGGARRPLHVAGGAGGRADVAAVSCLPCWTDWSVRFGASYDLFGTGNTALKLSVGKFLGQQALGLAVERESAERPDRHAHLDRFRPQRHHLRRQRQLPGERGDRSDAQRELRPAAGATQFDPNLPRPNNWEEAISSSTRCFRASR